MSRSIIIHIISERAFRLRRKEYFVLRERINQKNYREVPSETQIKEN